MPDRGKCEERQSVPALADASENEDIIQSGYIINKESAETCNVLGERQANMNIDNQSLHIILVLFCVDDCWAGFLQVVETVFLCISFY